jgi:glutathione S-transferase
VSIYQERFGYAILNNNEELLATVRKSLNDEVLPRHLTFFETLLKDSESGWIAGGPSPSIAE